MQWLNRRQTVRIALAASCLVLALRPVLAQDGNPANDGRAATVPAPSPPTESTGTKLPIEVAGYVNFQYLNVDPLQQQSYYTNYSGSLFLSKTLGRWRFHAEVNATNAPQYDAEGIQLFPRRQGFSLKLDSGSVNYNFHDWLQGEAGLLFIPTYWRTHRYQSNTLTVDDPLIDQAVFPTSFKGGMIHGDRYFGEGGFSYMVYSGVDQQSEFLESLQTSQIERATVVGGKLVAHVPSRQFFNTLDVSVHRLHRIASGNDTDEIYGVSLEAAKDRAQLLAEFDHSSIDVNNGVRGYIRQGYYVQPSYRLTRHLFAVTRYDRLDRDSRYPVERNQNQLSAGLTYRPIASVSVKVAGNRYEAQPGQLPAYYGFTTSLVYFFHLP